MAGLALDCGPARASKVAESPADAPEVVIPATTAAGTATATATFATAALDSLMFCVDSSRFCVNRLRFFLCRADTNYLCSGTLCARLPPGALPADDKTPGQGRGADVTQVQGDASLGATITRRVLSAIDCAGRAACHAPKLTEKGCDKKHV
jgi:hypothetical protein